jgi:hypothetical protein
MKFLALVLMAVSFAASSVEAPPNLAPQVQPVVEAPIRVAVTETRAVETPPTVRKSPAPEGWLLLLAGLAFAGWIAHRRLSYL